MSRSCPPRQRGAVVAQALKFQGDGTKGYSEDVAALCQLVKDVEPGLRFQDEHYQFSTREREIIPLPEGAGGIQVDALLQLFDETFNPSTDSVRRPGDPQKVKLSRSEKNNLRAGLEMVVLNIAERRHFTGVPYRRDEANKFFDDITLMLQHLIYHLREKADLLEVAGSLRGIAKLDGYCTAAYLDEIGGRYDLITRGTDQLYEEERLDKRIHCLLYEIRKGIVQKLVYHLLSEKRMPLYMEPHLDLYVRKMLTKKLGIKGLVFSDFDDAYEIPVPEREVLRHFHELYTPTTIIDALYEYFPGGRNIKFSGSDCVDLFSSLYDGAEDMRAEFLGEMLDDNLNVRRKGMIFILKKIDIFHGE